MIDSRYFIPDEIWVAMYIRAPKLKTISSNKEHIIVYKNRLQILTFCQWATTRKRDARMPHSSAFLSPECGYSRTLGERCLCHVVLKVLVEVAPVAVLAGHERRLTVQVGPHQPRYVPVPDGRQDPRLRLKAQPKNSARRVT